MLYGVKKYLDAIQVQQNKIIKILIKTSTYRVSLISLCNELSLLKILSIYQNEICKFLYRYINNKLLTAFSDYFTPLSAIHGCKTEMQSTIDFQFIALTKL